MKLSDHGIFFVEMFWLGVHSLFVIVRFATSSDLLFLPGSVLVVYAVLEICAFHPVHSILVELPESSFVICSVSGKYVRMFCFYIYYLVI